MITEEVIENKEEVIKTPEIQAGYSRQIRLQQMMTERRQTLEHANKILFPKYGLEF